MQCPASLIKHPSETIQARFGRTKHRGPDMTHVIETGAGLKGFRRLAIMGLHEEGTQPFERNGNGCVCTVENDVSGR